MSFARIGQELGVSESQAEIDYKRACAEYGQESASTHKAKANSRFDQQLGTIARLVGVLRPMAEGIPESGKSPSEWVVPPNLEAAARLSALLRVQMDVSKAQATMNGAYAPQVVQHVGAEGGPVKVTLDDVSLAIAAARRNSDGVDPDMDPVVQGRSTPSELRH